MTQPVAPIDWPRSLRDHERWLRTVAYSRLRCQEGVDEVMQEVALAVVRQSAPLSDATKLTPWLYRLTVRQTLLFRRRSARFRKLKNKYAESVPATEASAEPTPLHWLLADERRVMIRDALHQLPARDVEMLLLKYSENWTYLQIASHLGTSRSAVQARLHRARQRLRGQLLAMDLVENAS